MNCKQPRIDRRLFLEGSLTFLGLGLGSIAIAQTPIERGQFGDKDLGWARLRLLDLVNAERLAAKTSRLELDDLACTVANAHAVDMAAGNFLSHWGRDGRKPYQRYAFAGGIDYMRENVSAADSITSVTPEGVAQDLTEMHTRMFGETPPLDGHRQAMLAPQNTHVGFGIAISGHSLRLAEIYLARYLQIDQRPTEAKPKSTVLVKGRLLNTQHKLHEVDVFYEALPHPAAGEWLRAMRPYSLPANYVTLRQKAPSGTTYSDGSSGDFDAGRDGRFRVPVYLFDNEPGIYTVVFWIRRTDNDEPFAAAQICFVGGNG